MSKDYKPFVIKKNILVITTSKKKAEELVDEQLSRTGYDDHELADTLIDNYSPLTKTTLVEEIDWEVLRRIRMKNERKEQYWNWFLDSKKYWGHGVTLKRLEKIKPIILNDKDFWDDILIRHSGLDKSPLEMKKANESTYKHCMGNMSGMIYQTMIDKKIIKV